MLAWYSDIGHSGQEMQHMNDNIISQYATRDIRTHDLSTGEELLIVYFPEAAVFTINGYPVARSQKFDLDGKVVFHRPHSDKLFTVAISSLTELLF